MTVIRRAVTTGWATLALLLGEFSSDVQAAQPASRAVILPTVALRGSECESNLPQPSDPHTAALARRVDQLLDDAAQDLGLTIELASGAEEHEIARAVATHEEKLGSIDETAWVLSPRIVLRQDKLVLRLVVSPPGSRILLVRTQEVAPSELAMRVVVMLTELVKAHSAGAGVTKEALEPAGSSSSKEPPPVRSSGRAVLALTSAALGAWVGYSLQRASGSDDPRLTYPLIAIGTGVGLGAAMVAADEWDVGSGDAWYIGAGALWPGISGQLLAGGYRVQPSADRYVYGMVGTASGMALASLGISWKDMSEGGALLTHSGGGYGTFLGGLTQMAFRGRTDFVPRLGMGYGSGIGVLSAGLLATQIDVPSLRVLFMDLAAGLGALGAAAAASPLLFVETDPVPESRERIWLGSVGLGTLAGFGVGWYLTRHAEGDPEPPASATISPFVSPLLSHSTWQSASPDPKARPSSAASSNDGEGWLLGVQGTW